MAHNDWGPDDFLDEFLDFDYGKPVPGHQNSGKSDRTPATENRAAEGKGQKKSYGLSDDSYKEYEKLRHNAEKTRESRSGRTRLARSLRVRERL